MSDVQLTASLDFTQVERDLNTLKKKFSDILAQAKSPGGSMFGMSGIANDATSAYKKLQGIQDTFYRNQTSAAEAFQQRMARQRQNEMLGVSETVKFKKRMNEQWAKEAVNTEQGVIRNRIALNRQFLNEYNSSQKSSLKEWQANLKMAANEAAAIEKRKYAEMAKAAKDWQANLKMAANEAAAIEKRKYAEMAKAAKDWQANLKMQEMFSTGKLDVKTPAIRLVQTDAQRITAEQAALNRQENILARVNRRVEEKNMLERDGASISNKVRAATESYIKALNDENKTTSSLALAKGKFTREMTAASSEISRQAGLIKVLDKNLNNMTGSLGDVSIAGQKLHRFLTNTQVALTALASFGGFREITQSIIELDKMNLMLNAVGGSAQKGAEYFDYIKQTADRLGIALQPAAKGFSQLLAAAQGSNGLFGIQDVKKIFEGVSEGARAMGLTTADTEGVFRALTQSMSKGQLMAEEVRQQLGDRMPVALTAMAKGTGVTVEQFNKMMQAGEITGDKLVKAMTGFATYMSNYAQPVLNTATSSMQANIERLGNAWLLATGKIGESGFTDAVSNAAKSLTEFLNSNDGQAILEGIGKAAKIASDGFVILMNNVDALIIPFSAFIAMQIAEVFLSIASAATKAGGAVALLNTAILANPYVRLAAVIGAAAGGVTYLYSETVEAAKVQSNFSKEVANTTSLLDKYSNSSKETASSFVSDISKQIEAVDKLIKAKEESVKQEKQSAKSSGRTAFFAAPLGLGDLFSSLEEDNSGVAAAERQLGQLKDQLNLLKEALKQAQSAAESSGNALKSITGGIDFKSFDKYIEQLTVSRDKASMLDEMEVKLKVTREAMRKESVYSYEALSEMSKRQIAYASSIAAEKDAVDALKEAVKSGNQSRIDAAENAIRASFATQQANAMSLAQLVTEKQLIEEVKAGFISLEEAELMRTSRIAQNLSSMGVPSKEDVEQRIKDMVSMFTKVKKSSDTVGNSFSNTKSRFEEIIDSFNKADDAAQTYYENLLVSGKHYSAQQAEELGSLKTIAGLMKAFPKFENKAKTAVDGLGFADTDSDVKRIYKAVEALDEYRKSIDTLKSAVESGSLSEEQRIQTLETLAGKQKDYNDLLSKAAVGIEAYAEQTRKSAEQQAYENEITRLQSEGTQSSARRIAELIMQRDKAILAAKYQADMTSLLTAKQKAEKEGIEENIKAIDAAIKAREALYSQEKIAQNYKNIKDASDAELVGPMGKAFKNMTDELEDGIKDAFANGFSQGENLGESMLNGFKQTFKRMLAELAYQAMVKPILMPVMQTVGTSVFGLSQNAANQALGLPLSQQGSNSGGIMGDVGNMLSLGGTLFQSLGDVGLMQSVVSGASELAFNATGSAGFSQALGIGLEASPWGAIGAIGANLLGLGKGADPYASMALSTAGSIAGGAIGGTALGAELGSAAGPIGAVVGAVLGTSLSGLFPADQQYPMAWYDGAQGSTVKVQSLDGGDTAPLKQAGDSAQSVINKIATLLKIPVASIPSGGFTYNPNGHPGTAAPEGFSFFMNTAQGGGWENATKVGSMEEAIQRYIVESLKSSDISTVGDLSKRVLNSGVSDLEKLANALDLSERIQNATAGLDSLDTSLEGVALASKKALKDQLSSIKDSLNLADEVGIGTEYRDLLTRQLRSYLDPATTTYTEVEKQLAQLTGQFDALAESSSELSLGITSVEIATAKTSKIAKMQDDYSKTLDQQLNSSLGKDYLNGVKSATDSVVTAQKDIKALWSSSEDVKSQWDKVLKITANSVQRIVDDNKLTGDSFEELMATLKGSLTLSGLDTSSIDQITSSIKSYSFAAKDASNVMDTSTEAMQSLAEAAKKLTEQLNDSLANMASNILTEVKNLAYYPVESISQALASLGGSASGPLVAMLKSKIDPNEFPNLTNTLTDFNNKAKEGSISAKDLTDMYARLDLQYKSARITGEQYGSMLEYVTQRFISSQKLLQDAYQDSYNKYDAMRKSLIKVRSTVGGGDKGFGQILLDSGVNPTDFPNMVNNIGNFLNKARNGTATADEYVDAVLRVTSAYNANRLTTEQYTGVLASLEEEYSNVAAKANETSDSLKNLGVTIDNYLTNLKVGELSTLSTTEKRNTAKQTFTDAVTKARNGDVNAVQNLTTYADAFLNASKTLNTTSTAYASDYDFVTTALATLSEEIENQQTPAQKTANSSVISADMLTKINSVISIAKDEQIKALNGLKSVSETSSTAISGVKDVLANTINNSLSILAKTTENPISSPIVAAIQSLDKNIVESLQELVNKSNSPYSQNSALTNALYGDIGQLQSSYGGNSSTMLNINGQTINQVRRNAIARELGYTGEFYNGDFQTYLGQNSAYASEFYSALSLLNSPMYGILSKALGYSTVVGSHQNGGIVGNGYFGIDSVLASYAKGGQIALAGGEFVMPAPQTATYMPYLLSMQSGTFDPNTATDTDEALLEEMSKLVEQQAELITTLINVTISASKANVEGHKKTSSALSNISDSDRAS